MRFETEKRAFLRALASAVSVIERRNTIPILSNVHLDVGSEGLTVKASDMDIETTDRIAANASRAGSTTVHGAMLHDIVKRMPDGAIISFDAADGTATIKAGRSKFQLPTLPAEDYPVMASSSYQSEFEVGAPALDRLFGKSKFAASTEETKYYLNGVFLHRKGDALRAVATDGHRLAQIEVAAPEGMGEIPGVIVPRKTVDRLIGILKDATGNVHVSVSETKIRVSTDTVSIVSKVIEGSFPDYERVIPRNAGMKFSVDAVAMRASMERVSSVLNDRTNAIKVEISSDNVTMSASGPSGSATDQIETGYDGKDIMFGFNGKYMVEIMNNVEDLATFECDGQGGAIIIRDSDDVGALFVCMPMRV